MRFDELMNGWILISVTTKVVERGTPCGRGVTPDGKGAQGEWPSAKGQVRRTIHIAPRVFMDPDPFVKLRFDEMMDGWIVI